MSFPYEVTLQSMRDIQNQAPNAICEMTPTPVAMNLLVNRDAAPFNDPDIRRAMQLTIDRKSFLDIIAEGQGDINGAMQSPPAGLWGLPPEILATLPGYGPDVAANRAQARQLMEKHGYGPDHRLAVKVAVLRDVACRDLDGQPVVRAVAVLHHQLARLGAIDRDIGPIARQGRENLGQEPPQSSRR